MQTFTVLTSTKLKKANTLSYRNQNTEFFITFRANESIPLNVPRWARNPIFVLEEIINIPLRILMGLSGTIEMKEELLFGGC
jgi:hypothetical protein